MNLTNDYIKSTTDFLYWLEISDWGYNEDVKMYKNKDGRLKTIEEIVQLYYSRF